MATALSLAEAEFAKALEKLVESGRNFKGFEILFRSLGEGHGAIIKARKSHDRYHEFTNTASESE